MISTENVIKLAIEGGWHYSNNIWWLEITSITPDRVFLSGKLDIPNSLGPVKEFAVHLSELFLDPLFWQALGRVMEWEYEDPAMIVTARWKLSYSNEPDEEDDFVADTYKENNEAPLWLYYWHLMIDSLAEGKTVEDFFEQLKLKE